jgi:hypothetical protein
MMTTTCLIGLGIVPEAVVTDVSEPVFVYCVVRVPLMLVIVKVGEVIELVVDSVIRVGVVIELVVDSVVAMVVVIDVVELVI